MSKQEMAKSLNWEDKHILTTFVGAVHLPSGHLTICRNDKKCCYHSTEKHSLNDNSYSYPTTV